MAEYKNEDSEDLAEEDIRIIEQMEREDPSIFEERDLTVSDTTMSLIRQMEEQEAERKEEIIDDDGLADRLEKLELDEGKLENNQTTTNNHTTNSYAGYQDPYAYTAPAYQPVRTYTRPPRNRYNGGWQRSFIVFPPVYHPKLDNLDGDKVIFPPSVLQELCSKLFFL